MKQRPVRKLLALVLSLLLVFAFTPAAFAEEGNVARNATTGILNIPICRRLSAKQETAIG